MKTTGDSTSGNPKTTIRNNCFQNKAAYILLSVVASATYLTACQDSPAEPDEEPTAYTYKELLYSNLLGNFYDQVPIDVEPLDTLGNLAATSFSYQPSCGMALNESNPYERTELCETYEEAVDKFMTLADVGDVKAFTDSTENGISKSLGEYGTVDIRKESGDGVVARANINLKDVHPYTLLFKRESAFDSNDVDFRKEYSLGDIVSFKCLLCERINHIFHTNITDVIEGLVINVERTGIGILTNHIHSYTEKDHWKEVNFCNNVVSLSDWNYLTKAWSSNADLFEDTAETGYQIAKDIVRIMKGIPPGDGKNRLCVDGNDINKHRHQWKARSCIWSGVKWIAVGDLSTDYNSLANKLQFSRYAYHSGINNKSEYLYYKVVNLSFIDFAQVNLRHVYPIY